MADIPPTGPISWSDFRKVSGRQGNAISASDLNMSGPNQPFKNSIVVASKTRGTSPKLPMRFSKQVTNSILGLYSMKLSNPEYTGPVVQIKRSSDNALLDFYADMNGTLVSATGVTYTTWISESSDGSVMIWYDQSGGARHATPTLTTDPPQLVTDPAGSGKYVIYFPSTGYGFNVPTQAVSATMIQYYTLSKYEPFIFQYIISESNDLSLRLDTNVFQNGGQNGDDFLTSSGGFAAFDGTYNASSPYFTNTDNTWHSICASKTSGSLNIVRIGTSEVSDARSFYGYMSEVITFSAPLQAVNSTVPEYDLFYKNTHIPSWSRGLIANYSPENWNGTSSWLDNYSTNHGTQSGGTVNLTSTANMENLFTSLTSGAQTSARGIYSCRRINTNYTGPTFNIRRWNDNVTQDFYANGNGDLGTTVGARGQSIAEWLGASTAYVATWYDQSGQGKHATQATSTTQPVLDTGAKRVDFGGQTNAFLSLPDGTVPLQTPYTAIVRHGNMSQADGGFFFAGQAATNLGHGMRKSDTGYIDYWNNNDISTGTNTFRTENIVSAGSSTTFVNGEFPPVALGDYTRTLSDLPYGNGPYVIRASSSVNYQSSGARNAFDKGGGAWIGGTYIDDAYAGSAETVANGITYRGEWIELQLPYAISLKYYMLYRSSNSSWSSRMIKDWVLLGSNDGSTWNVVDTQTGITNWPGSLTFVTNSVTAYSYYRVSIQKGRASTGTNNISIGELYFYGDGVESAVYVNGTLTTVNTRTGLAAIQVAGSEVLGKSAGSEFLNGTMYDCWLFNSYLSGNDKIIIENTLMNCSTTAPSLWGNAGTNINFPAGILPATYTLFHNTRYNRNALGARIWSAQTTNFLSGHHGGKSGLAHHNVWITPQVNRHDVNWITCTDQLNTFRSLGKNRQNAGGASGVHTLRIGSYNTSFSEPSNWASTGAIVFNRELNASEIKHVEDFIASKYKTPIPPQEGLALSLDASDFSTSDSTTTWFDRSGGARNFTLSNASAYKAYSPTDNNTFQFPYMDFSQYFATATSGTDVSWSSDTNTFIWFGTIKNSKTDWRSFLRSLNNGHQIIINTGTNSLGVYNGGFINLDQNVDVSFLDKVYTRFNMHVWKMSSVSPYMRYYFNPSLAPCMPKGISTNANSWIPLGFYWLGGHLGVEFAGLCGTTLLYNRDVSDEELVEIYKRHMVKYELPAPMPSLNPIGNGYIFTKNTTFIVPAGVTSVKVLAIAGGGGGGGGYEGGGGGAGGLIYNTSYAVTAGQSITVTIGLGGYGARLGSLPQSGQNTVFGTLTAYGGGSGGTEQYPNQNPANGGSGGGAGYQSGYTVAATGTAGQGNNGGVTLPNGNTTNGFSAGGGGGADGVGGNTTTTRGGNGGPGREITILGITKYYAGGGAGARRGNSGGFDGQGGIGGGGSASCFGGAAPDKGGDAKFYGSGGGGGANNSGLAYGGDGFQGLVMVDWT